MAAKPSAKLIGLRQATKAFKQVDPIVRKHFGPFVEQSGERLVTIAQSLVPVRFGILRRFIGYRFSEKTGVATVGIRKGTASLPLPGGRLVTPSVYGWFVHRGTSRMRGRPFMLEAKLRLEGPFRAQARTVLTAAQAEIASHHEMPTGDD